MEIISGIYKITNKLNGHKYIGSSIDIETRWEKHKNALRGIYHHNPHLQHAWNKYGEDAFEFKIMAYTDPDKAVVLEDFILQNYFDRFEYNIAENAIVPFLGREHSEETKRKMSELKLGENNPFYEKHHSKEAKHKMSKAQSGKNHPMYGKHLLEETKQKLSEAMSGRTPSEETKQKMSKAHSGKCHSEETKQKISKSELGEKHHNWIDIPDEEIMAMKSLREQGYNYYQIADIFGISHGTVWNRLNAKQ